MNMQDLELEEARRLVREMNQQDFCTKLLQLKIFVVTLYQFSKTRI